MDDKTHWETVYTTKDATGVSWYQARPALSLAYIERTGIGRDGHIVDVGGGASTLVDHLLAAGYRQVTVVDIAAPALETARTRLGAAAPRVTWCEADVTRAEWPVATFDIWHDRAVFHFLTQADERRQYVERLRHAVKSGGHVIMATFGIEGPPQCSGLPVMHYDAPRLHAELGDDFALLDSTPEHHRTPFGTEQAFLYTYWRKR